MKSTPSHEDVLGRLILVKRQFFGTDGQPFSATFTLENKNDFAIKDFTVRFAFYGNSGTEISNRKQTFYEVIPAKGAKTIKKAQLGFIPRQSFSVSAQVVDYGIP